MRSRRLLAVAGLALALQAVPTGAALAAEAGPRGAGIDHAQPVDGAVELLVSVPADVEPDLDGVAVSIDGEKVPAEAVPAARDGGVRRTAVLAIDTSLSMRGERIEAAQDAALAYLDTVPDDVRVGVVTFDAEVRTLIRPTRDRDAARDAVADLPLQRETALYDGVLGALELAGPEGAAAGQRSVLLLSDGEDSTDTALSDTLREVEASGVLMDVVALQQRGAGALPLRLLAEEGRGRVLDASDPAALTETFEAEAQALARQVVVTARVPEGALGADEESADVVVTMPTAAGADLSAAAYLPVVPGADPEAEAAAAAAEREQVDAAARAEVAAPEPTSTVSRVVVLGAIGAIGLALLGAVLTVGLVRRRPDTGEALRTQLQAYGVFGATPSPTAAAQPDARSISDQAKDLAGKALESQAGLEARISGRLEGAGASLKAAEWLLLHATVVVGATALGLLLGRGNPVLLLVGIVGGLVAPWLYLGIRRGRRLKAFAEALPDTLQLMSGSLSAGLSLAQSVDTIVREGGDPVAGEFKRAMVESRLGVPFEDALSGIAQRMDSKDFEWVVMAIKIQREVGGNLAELLLQVSATLREREYLRRHVRALSAEGRLSAWVLGGLPPGFLLYLTVTRPDYTETLYTTQLGWVLLIGSLLLMGVGVLWMVKAGKVEL